MTCLVTGFPSKIAALQFEWAWQNTHITRHVSAEERDSTAGTSGKAPPQSGKARPRPSLKRYLSSLHLLLCAKSFERWPLKVAFFSPDVWKRWNNEVDSKVREGIIIELVKPETLDVLGLNHQATMSTGATITEKDYTNSAELATRTGIHAIDVGYNSIKPHLEKSRAVFDNGVSVSCGVCERYIRPNTALVLVCPVDDCRSCFHLTCLARKFLRDGGDDDAVVPLGGKCPSCHTKLEWSTLTKELSLRIRGQKEVVALFKERRRKKEKPANASEITTSNASNVNNTEEDHDTESDDDVYDLRSAGLSRGLPKTRPFNDDDDDESWVFHGDDDISSSAPFTLDDGQLLAPKSSDWNRKTSSSRLEIVIEDSEDDDVEILG